MAISENGIKLEKADQVEKPLLSKFKRKGPEEKTSKPKKVSIFQLYRYATKFDLLLVLIGASVAIMTGLGLPYLSVLIGSMSEAFVNATMATEYYLVPVQTSDGWKFLGDIYSLEDFERAAMKRIWISIYMGIALFLSATIQVNCFLTACENMMGRIRRKFFNAILRQDMAWYDNNNTGTLATKLFDDLERMREGTGDKVALAIQYTAQFFGGFLVAFTYDWYLTSIMMSLAPLMMGSGAFIAILMARSSANEAEKYAKAGNIAEEALSSVRTVYAFNGQMTECSRYEDGLKQARWSGMLRSIYIGTGFAFTFVVLFSSYCIAFWVGTNLVIDNGMHPEVMITVFFAVMMGSMALGQASPQFAVIGTAQGTAASIYEIIDRETEIEPRLSTGKVLKNMSGHISISNVSFSYPSRPEVKVLQSVSLEIKPGEVVALVGASGSGKSTLCSLLLRYYDVNEGSITIDEEPIKELDVHFLRRSIGIVSQEPVLFNMTIKENIQCGSAEELTEDQIRDACKQANAAKFVESLPLGYKTCVGERGIQLSGGQKQRIAIARALVGKPKVLLLDESTSALDAESEAKVQEALDKASKGRTTLIIAHRLSTVKNADRIVAMENGEIVESGSHEELMERKGVYYNLVNAQVFDDAINETGGDAGCSHDLASNSSRNSSPVRNLARNSIPESSEAQSSRRKKPDAVTELKRLEKELKEENAKPKDFLSILKYARPEWWMLSLGVLVCIIEGCVFPLFSVFFSNVLEVFAGTDPEEKRANGHWWALSFLFLGLVQGLSMFLHAVLFGFSAERLTMRLRSSLFHRILSQDMSYFDQPSHSPGKLCTRLSTDAPNVKSAIDYRLGSVFSSIVSFGCGIVLAFYYNWAMAILVVCIFPLGGVGHYFHMRYIKGRSKDDENEWENVGKVAIEAVENIRTVRSLALEDVFYNNFCDHLERPMRTLRIRARFQGFTYGFASSIFYFLHAASFGFGVYLIMSQNERPMSVLRCLFAISFTAGSMGYASAYFPEYAKARFAAGIIFKMLNERPKVDNQSSVGRELNQIDGSISLKDVYFSYPQRIQAQVLRGLNLEIPAGKTIALVGASGCGKSTVFSLIERFYDPNCGDIAIDGINIREVGPLTLRKTMAMVSQEPVLFDRSIKENILYGIDHQVDDEKLEEVLKMANISQFISELPEKLNTRVGDRGTQLSGGQKQRVAVARALIREPKLLLLDEATSALDSESERVVQQAIDRATQGRTCIIIAHRLSTIMNADMIAVIKDGQLFEFGTHQELLDKKGVYSELVEKQNIRGRGNTNDL
ncbi:unnamed protein product [Bursaphelenchus xylophilus]|uniref:(pine wood nematode) hypothetical protein n=1 Tax=Bursaphelenchus xylophilus TaxID=6326 RepID=A0A1I7S3R1_BURXY|nr:unnamed protein product [Bursaphelenchus xylophilus]CAG9116475.1 unnamed protein product [Bursaphelenchus xylophilus]